MGIVELCLQCSLQPAVPALQSQGPQPTPRLLSCCTAASPFWPQPLLLTLSLSLPVCVGAKSLQW